jgi:hypothetical protein
MSIQSFWWGNLRKRDNSEDPGVDGRTILIWIFRKRNGGIDWIDLAKEVVYPCKRSSELLGTIKCGKFLD